MTTHEPNLSVITPLSLSPNDPLAGETVALSATIRNNEDQPIKIDSIGIPIRYYDTYNYDVGWTGAATLAPGSTQTLTGSIKFDKAGPYTTWISTNIGGRYTSLTSNITRTTKAPSPDFSLTYIETPNIAPAVGEDVVVKFKLKNNLRVPITMDAVGVVGRYGNPYTGANRDFGWVGPETFAPGEEKSYTTFVSTVSGTGNFYAWVAVNHNGTYTQYNNWGFMMTPHLPNLTLSTPLAINSNNPFSIGQTVSVTATIKNNETKPIRYNAIGLPIRFHGVYNYDTGWQGAGTFAPSGQSGDTISLSGPVKFDKPGPYTVWPSVNIGSSYYTIGTPRPVNL